MAAYYAREALAQYSPRYGTPAQVAAITLALNESARVLCVDAMGELAFLVFRPVSPKLEETLNALVRVPLYPSAPCTHYVTDNPNWERTPYWDINLEA